MQHKAYTNFWVTLVFEGGMEADLHISWNPFNHEKLL
jgi:hypothetical protein